jgi:hypothetical protein
MSGVNIVLTTHTSMFFCNFVIDLYDVVCDDIDILIHAQRVCPQPLHKCRSVAHVMDTQDRLRPSLIDMKSMIGEIFLSTPAALKYCVTKFCLRNPSYFDLQSCKSVVVKARAEATQKGQIVLANKRQGPPIGQIGRQAPQPKERHTMPLLVGLVGNAHVYGNISEALQRANIPFIRERDGNALIKNTCIFYSKITVAIAWSPFVDDTSHTVKKGGDYWHEIKPAERFTNPFWFDIPAIGHSKFWSYQAYGPELLCATVECAVDLVKRISRGEMSTVVGRVQRRVLKDTVPAYSVELMGKFLSDIHNMFQNSILISEKNASDLLDTHSFKYSFRNDSRMFYE